MKLKRCSVHAVVVASLVLAGGLMNAPAHADPDVRGIVSMSPNPLVLSAEYPPLSMTLTVDEPPGWELVRADVMSQPFMGNPLMRDMKLTSAQKIVQQRTVTWAGTAYFGRHRGYNQIFPQLTYQTPNGTRTETFYNPVPAVSANTVTLNAPASILDGQSLSLTGKVECFTPFGNGRPFTDLSVVEFKAAGSSEWVSAGFPQFTDPVPWPMGSGDPSFTYFVPSLRQSGTWRVRYPGELPYERSACLPAAAERFVEVLSSGGPPPESVRRAGPVIAALSDATQTTMVVSWQSPSDSGSSSVTGYKVGWIEENGRVWVSAPDVRLDQSPLTLINLRPGTSYRVHVSAMSAAGEGSVTWITGRTPGAQAVVTPPPIAPPPASDDVYDCSDFAYQEDAQVILNLNRNDPNALDADHDGLACEELSRRSSVPQLPGVVTPTVVPLTPVATAPRVAALKRVLSRISTVSAKPVRRGRVAGLSGVVTTYRGGKYVRASGLRVVLQRLVGKKWVNVAPATSKGARFGRLHGSVNLNVRPAKTTTYRWVFAGNSTVAPSVSKRITVTVIR